MLRVRSVGETPTLSMLTAAVNVRPALGQARIERLPILSV